MLATTIEHDAQDGGRGVGHELEKLPICGGRVHRETGPAKIGAEAQGEDVVSPRGKDADEFLRQGQQLQQGEDQGQGGRHNRQGDRNTAVAVTPGDATMPP